MFPPAVNYISQNARVSVLHMRRDRLGAREAFKCVPPDYSAALPAPVPNPPAKKLRQREAQVVLSDKPSDSDQTYSISGILLGGIAFQ